MKIPGSRFLLLLAVVLASCLSCKKKTAEESPPVLQPSLFTITFTDNFIADQYKAIVFISDPGGKTLADTTCTTNTTYHFTLKEGLATPAWMMVTIVNYEAVMHELRIHLNTYTMVTPGTSWTIRGEHPDSTGHITASLVNVPSPHGQIIYSNSGYYNLTFNPNQRTCMLYKSTDDLYVKVAMASGDRYKILPGIVPGGVYSVDMADAAPTEAHAIAFPFPVQNYEADIYGYKEQSFDSPVPILADMVISDGSAASSVKVSGPPAYFAGYHTQLMIQETYTSDVTWQYHTDGAIPGSFKKIEASVNSVQADRGTVNVQASGIFEMLTAHWEYATPALEFYYWDIFSPDTTQTVSLPELSPAFSGLFNSLAIDSLSLVYTELTDFQTVASYGEFLQNCFEVSPPKTIDRFEASSVRRGYGVKSLSLPQGVSPIGIMHTVNEVHAFSFPPLSRSQF
jgi:hypothetical protein